MRRAPVPLMQVSEPLPPQVFEPQGDPAQAVLLFACIAVPFGYWWLITVPEARLALAKDKRLQTGETNQYLQDLATDEASRPVERWFFSKWLRQLKPAKEKSRTTEATAQAQALAEVPETADATPSPAAETMTNGMPSPEQPTLQELFTPASLKGNATPQFFSGDNPIVVTVGTLLTVGVFATVARENSALAVDGLVLGAGILFGTSRLFLK